MPGPPGDGDVVLLGPTASGSQHILSVTGNATVGLKQPKNYASATISSWASNAGVARVTANIPGGCPTGLSCSLENGSKILISGASGTGASTFNDRLWTVANLSGTTFDLSASTYDATVSGGTAEFPAAIKRLGYNAYSASNTSCGRVAVSSANLTLTGDLIDAWINGTMVASGDAFTLTNATLEFDTAGAGNIPLVAGPVGNSQPNWKWTTTGPTTRSVIRTKAGATARARISRRGGGTYGGSHTMSDTDIIEMGDASNPAIDTWISDDKSYSVLTRVTFQNSGLMYYAAQLGANFTWNWTDVKLSGCIGVDSSSFAGCVRTAGSAAAKGPAGVRSWTNVRLEKAWIVNNGGYADWSGTNIYIGGNGFANLSSAPGPWAMLKDSIIAAGRADSNPVSVACGPMDNVFWYYASVDTRQNPHWMTACTPPTGAAWSWSNLMYEYIGTGSDGNFISLGAGGTAGLSNVNVTGLIGLPNANNKASGVVAAYNSDNGMAKYSFEHLTINLDGQGAFEINHTGTAPVGQIPYVKNGIYWATTANLPSSYLLWDTSPSPCAMTADVVSFADYNWKYNVTPGGGGNCYGQGYHTPFSKTTPGLHDITGDPRFVNPSRAHLLYAAADLGYVPQPASLADSSATLAALFADPSKIVPIMARIRWYLTPQDPRAWAAASDGSHLGAVDPTVLKNAAAQTGNP